MSSQANGRHHAMSANRGDYVDILEAGRRKRRLLVIVLTLSMFGFCFGILFVAARHGHAMQRMTSLQELNEQSQLTVPSQCESTLILMRHCEKTPDPLSQDLDTGDQYCSYNGLERNSYLAHYVFGKRWPLPSLLYSYRNTRTLHENYREIQSLQHISARTGVPVVSAESSLDMAQDFLGHLASGQLCGKVALVSWKHTSMGELSRYLGCSDCPKRFSDVYDQVWQLKYIFDEPYPVSQIAPVYIPKNPTNSFRIWSLYPSIIDQGLDFLQFSTQVGDYPPEGRPMGGGWYPGPADSLVNRTTNVEPQNVTDDVVGKLDHQTSNATDDGNVQHENGTTDQGLDTTEQDVTTANAEGPLAVEQDTVAGVDAGTEAQKDATTEEDGLGDVTTN